MKRTFLPLLLTLALIVLSGCSGETAEGIKMPFSSGVCKGENYQEIIADLEEAGFTNIQVEIMDDLITGFLTKDGEVEQVSVDGEAKYDPVARYPKDVESVVTYHTFPQKDEPEEPEEPNEPESSSEPIVDSQEQPENITTENNAEFLAVMAVANEYDSIVGEFVEKYKGQTIEFDGCIVLVANHEDYDTRYDVLLSAGDYVDEDTVNPGPLFKMEDVNVTDMGISDLYLPDFVGVGHNVHVAAKIVSYDYDRGLFMLDPVLVEER